MKSRQKLTIYIVRGLLIALSLVAFVFIFRNALANGEASAEQSYSVTIKVQETVGVINPSSPIATATGEDFELLHACVRNMAHFLEYLFLGACLFGAYLSYANRENAYFFFVPVCLLYLTAATDEYLQTLSGGRAAEFSDLVVDMTGAAIGIIVSLVIYALVRLIAHGVAKKKRLKKE